MFPGVWRVVTNIVAMNASVDAMSSLVKFHVKQVDTPKAEVIEHITLQSKQ
jgi:hypothetical protein